MSPHVEMSLQLFLIALGCIRPVQRRLGTRKREAQDLRPLLIGLSTPDLIVNITARFKRDHKECICLELLITLMPRLTRRRYEQL